MGVREDHMKFCAENGIYCTCEIHKTFEDESIEEQDCE